MKLEDTLKEQIESLIDWMLEQAELEPPSAAVHQERTLGLKEHAWFLREICLPKIPTQKIAMASIESSLVMDRPDGLSRDNGFLRAKGPNSEKLLGINQELSESPSEAAQPS